MFLLAIFRLLLAGISVLAVSGQYCGSDTDCPADRQCETRHSNRCVCRAGFVLWLGHCLPVRRPGQSCQVSPQCRRHDPRAICDPSALTCQCQDGYQLHDRVCQFAYEPTAGPAPSMDADEPEDASQGLRAILPPIVRHPDPDVAANRRAMTVGVAVLLAMMTFTCTLYAVIVFIARHQKMKNDEFMKRSPPPSRSFGFNAGLRKTASRGAGYPYRHPPPEAYPIGYAS